MPQPKAKAARSMPFSDLRPNPANPRKITPQKKKMLEAALTEFGDLGGIVFNVRTLQLVGGHQRTAAFEKVKPAVIITEHFDPPTVTGTVALGYLEAAGGERFAYREVDWPADKERAANIAANKSAGAFEVPVLQEMLHHLDAFNINLDLTMFSEAERGELMGGAPLEPEMNEKPQAYRITVTCRDGHEQADLMQRLTDMGLHCRATVN